MNALMASAGERGGLAIVRITLVADIGPQLITFDSTHPQPDHHAVVQFGHAVADAERQPSNGLVIGAVKRDTARWPTPSQSAAITSICLSHERILMGPIHARLASVERRYNLLY